MKDERKSTKVRRSRRGIFDILYLTKKNEIKINTNVALRLISSSDREKRKRRTKCEYFCRMKKTEDQDIRDIPLTFSLNDTPMCFIINFFDSYKRLLFLVHIIYLKRPKEKAQS